MKYRCIHFVGFRGEEYISALMVWGKPDYYHIGWDLRAQREIDHEIDTVIFAKGEHDQAPRVRSFDDIVEQ